MRLAPQAACRAIRCVSSSKCTSRTGAGSYARGVALAHHVDELLQAGVVQGHSEFAVLTHVTRAHITQIMNLLLLALEIQEHILHLPRTVVGRDTIRETHLRPIV